MSVSNSATLTALATVAIAPTQTTLMTWTKDALPQRIDAADNGKRDFSDAELRIEIEATVARRKR